MLKPTNPTKKNNILKLASSDLHCYGAQIFTYILLIFLDFLRPRSTLAAQTWTQDYEITQPKVNRYTLYLYNLNTLKNLKY